MNAEKKIYNLKCKLANRGVDLTYYDVATLRRAEMTLHRWYELECGTDSGHIERDEKTGKPMFFNCRSRFLQANDPRAWSVIADREKGAIKRIEAVCKENNVHYYIQTDPRGCSLYVSKEPMTDSNYSSLGYAVCD